MHRPLESILRAHGRSRVWAEGALLHIRVQGPFNREGIEAFIAQSLTLHAQLAPSGPFVTVAEILGTLVAPIEVWKRLEDHVAQVAAAGVPEAGLAWVVAEDVEGRSLFLPRAQAVYARNGRPIEVFTTMAAAEAWAQRRLRGEA
ncbi:MAG: hypothetical protein ACRC2H_01935 [Silanimonas sp.]